MNDNGFGLVSKGVLTEAEATLSVFQQAGLNASVARCADVDAEIQRLAQKPSKANVTHDTYLQCSRWTLTGACARRPLFMHSRCIAHAMPISMCHVPCAMYVHGRMCMRDAARIAPHAVSYTHLTLPTNLRV